MVQALDPVTVNRIKAKNKDGLDAICFVGVDVINFNLMKCRERKHYDVNTIC